MVLTAAAVIIGLIWSGVLPANMPWMSTAFSLVLFQWAFAPRKYGGRGPK